jgi:hypothetical protein
MQQMCINATRRNSKVQYEEHKKYFVCDFKKLRFFTVICNNTANNKKLCAHLRYYFDIWPEVMKKTMEDLIQDIRFCSQDFSNANLEC